MIKQYFLVNKKPKDLADSLSATALLIHKRKGVGILEEIDCKEVTRNIIRLAFLKAQTASVDGFKSLVEWGSTLSFEGFGLFKFEMSLALKRHAHKGQTLRDLLEEFRDTDSCPSERTEQLRSAVLGFGAELGVLAYVEAPTSSIQQRVFGPKWQRTDSQSINRGLPWRPRVAPPKVA